VLRRMETGFGRKKSIVANPPHRTSKISNLFNGGSTDALRYLIVVHNLILVNADISALQYI
jgi:hypothetical protein